MQHRAKIAPTQRRTAIVARELRDAIMQHSTKRILTTHAGSLPRPADLLDMLAAKAAGPSRSTRPRARRGCRAR